MEAGDGSNFVGGYCRYCWMRVVRRPARPCWSMEYCQERKIGMLEPATRGENTQPRMNMMARATTPR